jgi:hypothetical protein
MTIFRKSRAAHATLLAAVLVGAVALSACGTARSVSDSASILSFENEWTALYQQTVEVSRGGAGDIVAVRSGLKSLSERAEAQGDNASRSSDFAKAVSFYRIAATSAWQAGPPRNTAVLTVQEKGSAACAKLPQGEASQPRDCAFIRMAPSLAALDAKARKMEELRDAGPIIPANRLNEAEGVVSDVGDLTKSILDARTMAGAQSTSFDDYVKLNLNREFCTLQGFVGRISGSAPPADQKQRVIDAARAVQANLQRAAISTACS